MNGKPKLKQMMKKILLVLILAAVSFTVSAGEAPDSYMELKAQFKNMPVRVDKVDFVKKHVVMGVAAGAVMFAMNEYFIRTGNEAFHSVMPYVAIAYAIFQGYSMWRGRTLGSGGEACGGGQGVTLVRF